MKTAIMWILLYAVLLSEGIGGLCVTLAGRNEKVFKRGVEIAIIGVPLLAAAQILMK